MAATFPSPRFESRLATLNEAPDGCIMRKERSVLAAIPPNFHVSDLDEKGARYPAYTQSLDEKRKVILSTVDQLEHSYDPVDKKVFTGMDKTDNYSLKERSVVNSLGDDMQNGSYPDQPRQNGHVVDASYQTAFAQEDVDSPSRELTPDQQAMEASLVDEADNVTERAIPNDAPRPSEEVQDPIVAGETPEEEVLNQDLPANFFVDARTSPQEKAPSFAPSTPRSSTVPMPNGVSGANSGSSPRHPSPIIPASAGPGYYPLPISSPPISSTNKALAQHPTYNSSPVVANPLNSVYSPGPPPRAQEEVCVECMMRDQDMAGVDVTSPGVWERESDVYYQELVRMEAEEEEERSKNSLVPPKPVSPNRAKATGGKLTEQNLKVWMSMNPREPQAKQQTMELYVKAQTAFLEAEALARARAMKESRALENKMRNTYDQWRRSTNDLASQPLDDSSALRVRSSRASSGPSGLLAVESLHSRHHSRDITLLDNGLVVEHVDVRKEEKEERERRRKEEKRERSRVRKSSRSSAVDVTSMYSVQTPLPHPDSGFHTTMSYGEGHMQRTSSRFSQSSSRPLSPSTGMPLTPPPSRPSNFRLHSQNSLSETQSISASSMARSSRFLGFRAWSEAWKSRDSFAPSGMSGSMMDMHVALDQEANRRSYRPTDLGRSASALPLDTGISIQSMSTEQQGSQGKSKKTKGLGRILRIFTGGKRSDKTSQKGREEGSLLGRSEDDAPLAPPPPLSYLVDRNSGDRTSRHIANASCTSRSSIAYPMSSVLQTPVSSRQSWLDRDPMLDGRISVVMENEPPLRNIHPVLSEPDLRRRSPNGDAQFASSYRSSAQSVATARPISTLSLHKSLPPLPVDSDDDVEANVTNGIISTSGHHRQLSSSATMISPEGLPTPQPSFRSADVRRQSFGGMAARPDISFRRTVPLANQTLPSKYTEFGASRRSLGPLEDMRRIQTKAVSPPASTRRKSKFGLSSLFGRFSLVHEPKSNVPLVYEFPSDDSRQEVWVNDSVHSGSRRSHKPRLSVASRKAIEELVDQDPEFVAYRYPSVGQGLEFLR